MASYPRGLGRRPASSRLPGVGLALAGAATATAGVVVLRRRFLLITVVGTSMAPTYQPGDRVLLTRRSGARTRPGDVVTLRMPGRDAGDVEAGAAEDGWQWFLKRVVAVAGDRLPAGVPAAAAGAGVVPHGMVAVLGDGTFSLDSRTWGCVPAERVVGVVVRRVRTR